jgi:hypothetical protein
MLIKPFSILIMFFMVCLSHNSLAVSVCKGPGSVQEPTYPTCKSMTDHLYNIEDGVWRDIIGTPIADNSPGGLNVADTWSNLSYVKNYTGTIAGYVNGRHICSETPQPSAGSVGIIPSANYGSNCWCQTTSVYVEDLNYNDKCQSGWFFATDMTNVEDCNTGCAITCTTLYQEI